MAVQQTQVLPAPVLEGALTAFTKKLEPLIGQQINTAAYAPQIAAESALQQQARTAAGGLGSLVGPQAFEQFMSPYQQQVIETTLDEFDRQAAAGIPALQASAVAAGAFGGGREGVRLAEFQAQSDKNRAALQAQLLQQGFTQANQLAQQAFGNQGTLAQNQMGLSNFQRTGLGQDIGALGNLGALNQQQAQANLTANQQAAKTAAYEP